MNLRKYIKESVSKNIKSAYNIYGENTYLFFAERFATSKEKGGKKFEQIIFTIDFEDFGLSCSSKFNTLFDCDSLYVEYAISMLENDTMEEFYKACLLLSKNRLIESIKTYDKINAEYEKTGHLPYPYTNKKRYAEYTSSVNKYRKIVESIDIVETDLKHLNAFA